MHVEPGAKHFLLTAKEAAELLRISQRKLWSLTASGTIPFLRIGRAIRYDAADLRRWIDQQKEAAR